MEIFNDNLEQEYYNIELQENEEKFIFAIVGKINNNELKVESSIFAEGGKINIVKAIECLKDEPEAKEFNEIINYFKTQNNE